MVESEARQFFQLLRREEFVKNNTVRPQKLRVFRECDATGFNHLASDRATRMLRLRGRRWRSIPHRLSWWLGLFGRLMRRVAWRRWLSRRLRFPGWSFHAWMLWLRTRWRRSPHEFRAPGERLSHRRGTAFNDSFDNTAA